MAKPPPETPHSDIDGVRRDQQKPGDAPPTGGKPDAGSDLARQESRGRPSRTTR